jgi:uncharacterized membrane protein YkvA (DUF1232 family)
MRSRVKFRLASIKQEIRIYQAVLRDSETPRLAKWLLGLALAYLISPIDLIPDFIPILGQIDDLLIVPLLIGLALKLIPDHIVLRHRAAGMADARSF